MVLKHDRGQTDRQTLKHADMLIAILRTPYPGSKSVSVGRLGVGHFAPNAGTRPDILFIRLPPADEAVVGRFVLVSGFETSRIARRGADRPAELTYRRLSLT